MASYKRALVVRLMVLLMFAFLAFSTASRALADAKTQVAPVQDQNTMYLTVFGQEGEPGFEKLKAIVRTAEVSEVATANAVKYAEIEATSKTYTDRYAETMPALPCVRIQKPDGKVVYQTSGVNVPKDRESFVAAITKSCPRAILPWNSSIKHRPQAAPTPQAEPQENLNFTPSPSAQPDLDEYSSGPSFVLIALIAVLGLVVGVAAGVASSFKKETKVD